MTVSNFLGVIGLFQISIWSLFNFGMWYLSKKLSVVSFTSCFCGRQNSEF